MFALHNFNQPIIHFVRIIKDYSILYDLKGMEERRRDRIRKKLLIKVDDHTSVMEDMSGTGMRLVIPSLLKRREVNVLFQMRNLVLELKGIVRWIKKEPTVYDQSQYQVGLFIQDPPEEYVQLVESLLNE